MLIKETKLNSKFLKYHSLNTYLHYSDVQAVLHVKSNFSRRYLSVIGSRRSGVRRWVCGWVVHRLGLLLLRHRVTGICLIDDTCCLHRVVGNGHLINGVGGRVSSGAGDHVSRVGGRHRVCVDVHRVADNRAEDNDSLSICREDQVNDQGQGSANDKDDVGSNSPIACNRATL